MARTFRIGYHQDNELRTTREQRRNEPSRTFHVTQRMRASPYYTTGASQRIRNEFFVLALSAFAEERQGQGREERLRTNQNPHIAVSAHGRQRPVSQRKARRMRSVSIVSTEASSLFPEMMHAFSSPLHWPWSWILVGSAIRQEQRTRFWLVDWPLSCSRVMLACAAWVKGPGRFISSLFSGRSEFIVLVVADSKGSRHFEFRVLFEIGHFGSSFQYFQHLRIHLAISINQQTSRGQYSHRQK